MQAELVVEAHVSALKNDYVEMNRRKAKFMSAETDQSQITLDEMMQFRCRVRTLIVVTDPTGCRQVWNARKINVHLEFDSYPMAVNSTRKPEDYACVAFTADSLSGLDRRSCGSYWRV
jgi:hypothetical protein